MIDTGTGNAAYYADLLQAVITLAILAPCGPPLSTQAFLDRLNAKWLQGAWGDGRHLAEAEHARAAAKHLPDIQLRYATLLRRLGPALDGPGRLDEADAWYCILEGTREKSVAEAQAMALTELAAHAATSLDGPARAMLLAADDYSAVSARVPVVEPVRAGPVPGHRGAGLGPVLAGPRAPPRMSGTGSRPPPTAASSSCTPPTPNPSSRWRGRGGCWRPRTSSSGTRGVMRAPPASSTPGPPTPTWSAACEVGQACYIQRGAATFVQVARPRPSPLTLLPPPAQPPPAPVPEPAPGPRP